MDRSEFSKDNLSSNVGHSAEAEQALSLPKEGESWLHSVVHNSTEIIQIIAPDGTLRYANPALKRVLGYEPDEVIGMNVLEYVHPDDLPHVLEETEKALGEAGVVRNTAEFRFRHKNGSWRYMENVSTYLLDDPAVRGVVVNSRDVTERKQAEEALRKSKWRMAEAERLAHVGSWEWDVRSNTLSWSDELYRIFALSKDVDISYEGFIEGIHPADQEFVRGVIQAICEDYVPRAFSHRIIWPDGTVHWLQCETLVTVDEAGNVASLHGMTQDITELRQAEERLQYQANHDLLTNLPNRQLFLDRLEQALRRTKRQPGYKAAVLFVDLDNFKVVNDTLGHHAGDELLVMVSKRLRACLRSEDTLARLGGDEFAVLLEDLADEGKVMHVAGRIVEELRIPFTLDDHEVFVTSSIGIALHDSSQDSPEGLLRHADVAMYWAKKKGKARYKLFEPSIETKSTDRTRLEHELRRGIECEEFRLYYQPIVLADTGRIMGMEALVRWEHPERGLVLPDEFVPLAEETGLIVPIGKWVLREACRQAKEWQESYPSDPPLIVGTNLSARQLEHPNLADDFEAALRDSGLDPRSLTVEITESTVVKDEEHLIDALRRLVDLGIRLALDDFGTGYSALAYLRRLPVGLLKLDRSFLERLGKDAEAEILFSGVINIASGLGLYVLAEGVETPEQLELVKSLGCDLAQGNYVSEPLPSEALGEILHLEREGAHVGEAEA